MKSLFFHTLSLILLLVFTASCGTKLFAPGENTWAGTLEAYAKQNEVLPGEGVEIAAQANPPTRAKWQVRRVAWNDGKTKLAFAGGELRLQAQAMPPPDPETGLVEAGWPTSVRVQTGNDWPAGVYIVTFTAGERSTNAIFVINDQKPHDFYLKVSLTTYAAYNTWGGLSVYANNTLLPLPRAYRVSLDRPLADNGLGDFAWLEEQFLLWLTRAGYDLGYTTNLGVHSNPALLEKTKMLLLSGHDEYWSASERAAVDAAVERGMHLTSLSANTAYWKINLHPASDGRPNRIVECAKIGPIAEQSGTRLWRLEGKPEGDLLGAQFGWILDSWAPLVIGDVGDPLFEGTDMRAGDEFFGLMGPEVDGYHPPASATVLAYAPIIDVIERVKTAAVTVRRLPSGAQVFNASGNYFGYGLLGPHAHWKLQRLIANVLSVAGKPAIAPYFSPGYETKGVQRWLRSDVSTVALIPEGPRALVEYESKVLFTVETGNTVFELHGDGTYAPFTKPDVRFDGLTVGGNGTLYGVSLEANGVYEFRDGVFVRLNAPTKGVLDGPIALAEFSDPVQISAENDRILVVEHHRTDSRLRLIKDGQVITLPQAAQVVFTGLPLRSGAFVFGLADNRLWKLTSAGYELFSGSQAGWNDANYQGASYLSPYGIQQTHGGFVLVERYGHRIRFVTTAGGAWTVAGNGSGYVDGRGDRAQFMLPYGLLEASPGEFLVSDAGNQAIRKIVLHERP